MTQNLRLPQVGLRFLCIVLLVVGIFFRFVNLERKTYWHDEVYTSLLISGYTPQEFVSQVFKGNVIGVRDLQKYQRPNSEKGLSDTLKSLAIHDAQHPPLYYVLARIWVEWLGYSVRTIRSLSAVISLLVFPCIYGLCLELFGTATVGWFAIALLAISPFHVLFAQEAREYSLWTVTILLSSWTLLRAMRLQTPLTWGIYAATLALGLYSFLFTGLVALGHAIYVVGTHCQALGSLRTSSFRAIKTITAFLLASLAGILAFLPWLIVISDRREQIQITTAWLGNKVPLSFLLNHWKLNFTRVFVDFDSAASRLVTFLILPTLLILVGYSLYLLCRQTPLRIWLFILTLIGTTALALTLPDLIVGGLRSTTSRYFIPCYLGIQIAVAYSLTYKIYSASSAKQQIWQGVAIALVSAGVISCAVSSHAETWWNKVVGYHNPEIAKIINNATRPLLISDNSGLNVGDVLSLSYLLEPKVRLQLVVEPNIPLIPNGFSEVFVFCPSEKFQEKLNKKYDATIEPSYDDFGVLRLGKLIR